MALLLTSPGVPDDRSITLMHISDMQFGRHHRFGNLAAGDPDAAFETLFTRLNDDLTMLEDDHGLRPQVIVVSGDLAEWGLKSEFRDAFEFLGRLSQSLAVRRDRVVVIPGNHDVNRKLCESYFNECEGEEKDPALPYAPKWKHYRTAVESFYSDLDGVDFSSDMLWGLWRMDELGLIVAGLKSTMRESHRDDDHYGWVGEQQLRWFAGELGQYADDGWLRIGVVHHNVRRGAVDDDENLRDAADLNRWLGSVLNLFLHGHTHEGKTEWLHPKLPVLSTGSAALDAGARPSEVPNQYQVIRLHADRVERWARRYAPQSKRWEGDTGASANGGDWHVVDLVRFESAQRALGAAVEENYPRDPRIGEGRAAFGREHGFRDRVQEVLELRHGGPATRLTVQPIRVDDRHEYLRVGLADDQIVRSFPVGLSESGITAELVDNFCTKVFEPYYWALDRSAPCEIAYGGERATEELIELAAARNVRLRSFVELQGIIDFRGYVERQTARLGSDIVYPAELYVTQRIEHEVGPDRVESDDALARLMGWMREPRASFVLVLGDFGTGKTFLLRELARRMPGEIPHLVPMLIELRALEKAQTLEQLVAQHLAGTGERYIDLDAFPYMLREGRIALLFDGFDELAQRVTYQRATEHLDMMLQAAVGSAKVVVTSRTQHFESDRQVRLKLLNRAELAPSLSLCRLQPFNQSQIKAFLKHRLGDADEAHERYELIEEVQNLLGLSHNPRMLGFIAAVPAQQLREARERTGTITSAELYRLLIDEWLEYETKKGAPRGAGPTLSKEDRLDGMTALALRMWARLEPTIHISEMSAEISGPASSRIATPNESGGLDPDHVAHIVGSRTLLVREDDGAFSFVHQSVMEWLVAHHVALGLAAEGEPDALAQRPLTALMIDFLCDLAGAGRVRQWATSALRRNDGSPSVPNALSVLDRLGERISGASLAGQRLAGRDLSARDLHGSDFADADLTEAQLARSDLSDANLSRAVLARADLTGANLTGAVLDGADARGTSLLGADMRGATLGRTTLRRAKLTGAKIDEGALSTCDTFGAAPPEAIAPESRVATPALPATAIAVHAFADVLASGHDDGSVRLWDPVAGVELRTLVRHGGGVCALAFSHDGRVLASVGGDGTVQLVDPTTGAKLRSLASHEGAVRAVAFSPTHSILASAGDDGTVALWDPREGHRLRILTGHHGAVRRVAFSPAGSTLASAGDDHTVRLWDAVTGSMLGINATHHDRVRGLAFSPDGLLLASADELGAVRLWEATPNEVRRYAHHDAWDQIRSYAKHEGGAWDICFAPDGRTLATAGRDGAVRVWDSPSLAQLRTLDGHHGGVHAVAFSAEGDTLVSAGDDCSVRIWDSSTGAPLYTLRGHDGGVWGISIASDGQLLASASDDGVVRLWNPVTKTGVGRLVGHDSRARGVAFSPDGRTLASCGDDGSVRIWNVVKGTTLHRVSAHLGVVESVAFAPDGRTIASTGVDRSVRLWDPTTGASKGTLDGHTLPVRGVAFSPDGHILATASMDGTVRLWDTTAGEERRVLSSDQAWLWGVAFSPNGHMVAAAGDGKIVMWEVATGRELGVLVAHDYELRAVAFSPDGRVLASTTRDGEVRLWDPSAGIELHRMTGHCAEVLAIAFSPDGRTVASGSRDGTIRLWDSDDGHPRATLACLTHGWAAYTPEGRYKLSGRIGGGLWFAIGLCRFEPGELDGHLPEGTLALVPSDEPL